MIVIEHAIIDDLKISRSTARALADRLERSPNVIEAVLHRMELAGVVIQSLICGDRLTVWKLKINKPEPCSTL